MLPGFGFGGAPVVAAMNRALARITPKSVQRGWRDAIRRVLTILPRGLGDTPNPSIISQEWGPGG